MQPPDNRRQKAKTGRHRNGQLMSDVNRNTIPIKKPEPVIRNNNINIPLFYQMPQPAMLLPRSSNYLGERP
jgi:hypothetical protein